MCTVLVLTMIMLIVWLFVYYHVTVMGIYIFLLSVSNYDVEGFVLYSTCSNCSQSIKIPYCSLSCAVNETSFAIHVYFHKK